MKFFQDHMAPLLAAIRSGNRDQALEWSHSEHWATVEQLISATAASGPHSSRGIGFSNSHGASASAAGIGAGGVGGAAADSIPEQPLWTCRHCTFINPADLATCDMCSLPR